MASDKACVAIVYIDSIQKLENLQFTKIKEKTVEKIYGMAVLVIVYFDWPFKNWDEYSFEGGNKKEIIEKHMVGWQFFPKRCEKKKINIQHRSISSMFSDTPRCCVCWADIISRQPLL